VPRGQRPLPHVRGVIVRASLASFFLGLMLTVCATASPARSFPGGFARTWADTEPGRSGLHVDGNRLVDSTGQTVQLRGVNRSGTEHACVQGWGIFNGPNDATSVVAMKSWGINAVRIPLNEDCWLAINGVPAAYAGANYQQAIKNYVSLLNQNGLYAILDLHWTAPGSTAATQQVPMPDMDHSPAFWSDVATTFKGNNAAILELFNEPWPDGHKDSTAAWTCWRDGGTCPGVPFPVVGMQPLVDLVRATGATNVIAVGGVSYGNALSRWLTYRPTDPLNNLAAAWHVYNFNACNKDPCFDATAGVVSAEVPVLATEIGTNCDFAFMVAAMKWLDARRAGYFAWTWNTWGSACSSMALIADYAGTPTDYGQIFRTHLAARL